MAWIEVTQSDGKKVSVNTDHVRNFRAHTDGTYISVGGNQDDVKCKEDYDEIKNLLALAGERVRG